MNHSVLLRIVGMVTAAVLFTSAQAEENSAKNYPDRPIRVIVGYAAGGANDLVARIISQKLSEGLGRPVIVENKTGASGSIAAKYVADDSGDGYTLLFAPSSMFTTNPVMFKKVGYSLSDFVPISTVVTYPFVLVVSASQPIQSVKQLVEYLKENPRNANFSGSAGVFQLAYELFKSQTGTRGEYIMYKGTNQSVTAVMTGEVLMTIADGGPVSAALKGGKIRGLAVTSRERLASYPDIPTVAEAGYPELEMGSWMGLLAPARTPMPIVRRLQDEVNRIVKTPEFKERMNAIEVNPDADTSEQFAGMITSDLTRWRAVAKASNIEPAN
jgi:tripartite-type tricarboxylate transporter receptor subunit TctC